MGKGMPFVKFGEITYSRLRPWFRLLPVHGELDRLLLSDCEFGEAAAGLLLLLLLLLALLVLALVFVLLLGLMAEDEDEAAVVDV